MAELPPGFRVVDDAEQPQQASAAPPIPAGFVAVKQARKMEEPTEPAPIQSGLMPAAAANPMGAAALGVAEVGAQAATGIAGMIEAGWRGMADLVANDAESGAQEVGEVMQERTYQPKTDAAKGLQKVISEAGEAALFAPSMLYGGIKGITNMLTGEEKEQAIASAQEDAAKFRLNPNEAIGTDVLELTGSPAAAAGVETALTLGEMMFGSRSPKAYKKLKLENTTRSLEKFNEQLREFGSLENPTKTIKQRKQGGKVIDVTPAQLEKMDLTPRQQAEAGIFVQNNPAAKELKKQGFSDKRIALFNSIETSDIPAVRKMLNYVKRSKADPRFAGKNRVSDVLGETITERFKFLDRKNKEAGNKLNSVLKSERDKPVSFDSAINQFADDLADLDVDILVDDNGAIVPDFSRSVLKNSEQAQGYIKDLVERMATDGGQTLFEGHSLKKFIDENSDLLKVQEGLSKSAKFAIKKLRRNINGAMREASPKYAEANQQFADTIDTINLLQDSVGKKVDLRSPNTDKALGTAFRKVLSNYQSRQQQLDLLAQMDRITGKYGGDFPDSMYDQLLVANELETMFDLAPRNTLQGQVKSGVGQSLIDFSGDATIAAARVGANIFDKAISKARGVNEKAALKAIDDLLKRGERPNPKGYNETNATGLTAQEQ
jgi:hypothetical protein